MRSLITRVGSGRSSLHFRCTLQHHLTLLLNYVLSQFSHAAVYFPLSIAVASHQSLPLFPPFRLPSLNPPLWREKSVVMACQRFFQNKYSSDRKMAKKWQIILGTSEWYQSTGLKILHHVGLKKNHSHPQATYRTGVTFQ